MLGLSLLLLTASRGRWSESLRPDDGFKGMLCLEDRVVESVSASTRLAELDPERSAGGLDPRDLLVFER
jgi:hypothetical protein